MNKEVKEIWLEALKSGKYQKGDGNLTSIFPDRAVHCCLGVLCEITPGIIKIPNPHSVRLLYAYKGQERAYAYLPESLGKELGLEYRHQSDLADMNDEDDNWDRVISYIETEL